MIQRVGRVSVAQVGALSFGTAIADIGHIGIFLEEHGLLSGARRLSSSCRVVGVGGIGGCRVGKLHA